MLFVWTSPRTYSSAEWFTYDFVLCLLVSNALVGWKVISEHPFRKAVPSSVGG